MPIACGIVDGLDAARRKVRPLSRPEAEWARRMNVPVTDQGVNTVEGADPPG
eukprot:gene32935-11169_t